ncbi:MAG: EAL domain-containing protein [Clostridia bacterium]|nr:EAL domain-containing protein [Clostridia bacterium]
MNSFSIIIPGVVSLLVLFGYYFTSPRLPIKLNRIFLRLLVTEVLVMLAEFAAIWLNNRYTRNSNTGLLYVVNMLFCLSYLFKSYQFFAFSAVLVKQRELKQIVKWMFRLVWIACSGLVVSSFWWKTVFEVSERHGYREGPLWFIVAGCAIFYVLLSAVIIFIYRKKVSEWDLMGAVTYNTVLLVCAVVRLFIKQNLVVTLVGFLAVLVCYLSFETPGRYISERGAAFNKRAFKALLEESLEKKTYRALAFVLRDYTEQRVAYGSEQMDKGISLIIDYLRHKYKKHLIFYLRNGYFVIFDPEALNLYRIRDDLYERFKQPWQANDTELYLSVAFIKVGAESNIDSADMLINNLTVAFERAGHMALYGKDIFDLDDTKEIEEQAMIKGALEYAVKHNSVELFLQPVVDGATEELVGAEALARIRDENGKIISPVKFIPIAEQSGHINSVGEQVFKQVCGFVNSNGFSKVKMRFVNVNLSPIQCMREDLSDRFYDILRQNKALPERIHLEITEQSMGDSAQILKQVNKLKDCGFQFALDDYGSGYSNFMRLKYYPFKNVKLDMEVVRSYYKNRDPLIMNIISLLKQMGYSVTAEGIESKEMADLMVSIGCDFLQGFYYSKPLPVEEFVEKYTKI